MIACQHEPALRFDISTSHLVTSVVCQCAKCGELYTAPPQPIEPRRPHLRLVENE